MKLSIGIYIVVCMLVWISVCLTLYTGRSYSGLRSNHAAATQANRTGGKSHPYSPNVINDGFNTPLNKLMISTFISMYVGFAYPPTN